MLKPVTSSKFKKDVRQAQRRGKDMEKLKTLIDLLVSEEILPESYQDHPLRSNWSGFRDAHVDPDWLLIYKVSGKELHLARTGTHSDIFG